MEWKDFYTEGNKDVTEKYLETSNDDYEEYHSEASECCDLDTLIQNGYFQEQKRKLEEHCIKNDISLPRLEKEILKWIIIRKIWGRIVYFNGTHYEILTEDIFCLYCKRYLPMEIQNKICSVKIFKSLYRYVLYDFVTEKEEAREDNYLISCENCVVNAQTLNTYMHDKSLEVSYCVKANYVEDVYDYPAPHNFEQLIRNMTDGDEETMQLIWQMLGYVLLHVSPKRAFFWLGTEPASGKSLLCDFIQRLLGRENCSLIEADDIGKRFSMAQFTDKRVNLGAESSGKLTRNDVVRIKEITGNKTFSIEKKGVNREDFPNYTVLIFASNEPLNIGEADLTEAFWDRCKLIPCVKSCPIEERDVNLLEKIWEERDLIVSRAIEAACNLIEREFQFIEPQVAKRMKIAWRRNNGSLISNYVDEYLEIVTGNQGYSYFTPTEELYKHYIKHTGDMISKNSFSGKLNRYTNGKLIKDKRRIAGYTSAVNGFYNVRIKTTEDENNE